MGPAMAVLGWAVSGAVLVAEAADVPAEKTQRQELTVLAQGAFILALAVAIISFVRFFLWTGPVVAGQQTAAAAVAAAAAGDDAGPPATPSGAAAALPAKRGRPASKSTPGSPNPSRAASPAAMRRGSPAAAAAPRSATPTKKPKASSSVTPAKAAAAASGSMTPSKAAKRQLTPQMASTHMATLRPRTNATRA